MKRYLLSGCLIVLLCVTLAGCSIVNWSLGKETPNCELLAPLESPMMLSEEKDAMHIEYPEVDFAEKTTISTGKYGFRYMLEIEEPIVFYQTVPEDLQFEAISYGIYEDEALQTPVSEIHIKDVLEFNHKFEMGEVSREDYPEYREWNKVTLEPGIYYLGVYSTDSKDESIIVYESTYEFAK